MKSLKKVLAIALTAATIFSLAPATVSAKAPKTTGSVKVALFKEKMSDECWLVDEATNLIAFRNLKWNAKLCDWTASNGLTCVKDHVAGTYYVDLCADECVKPGDSTKLSLCFKQDCTEYEVKTTVKYVQAASPLASFTFTGYCEGETDYRVEFAQGYAGYRTRYFAPGDVTCVVFNAAPAANKVITKVVACCSDGCEYEIKNGDKLDLCEICSIKISYLDTVVPKYFKANRAACKLPDRLPVAKYIVLNFV